MTRDAFARRCQTRLGTGRWRAGAPLGPLTTFGVGGPAEWLADVQTVDEMQALVADAAAAGVPLTILGGGSNLLVSDEGVPGLVVRLHLTAIAQPAPDRVRAEAGVTINGLVRWTVGRGLAGLEAWAGTPGTVGGAVSGNAHWGSRNIGDLIVRVALIDAAGRLGEVPAAAMEFAYDTSRIPRTHEVVVWADLAVTPADPVALREEARASLHYRKRTQPLAQPSAGCIFRNPDPGTPSLPADVPASAGALIDRAGLKGHRVGGASISTRHANFIVNEGGATARDVRALIELARGRVRERFGIELRDEVVYMGTFRDV